jgi:allene oxide cyclase
MTVMNTLSRTIPVAALLALLALPVRAGEHLAVVERALTDTTIHLGAKSDAKDAADATIHPGARGDSIGDLLTFANPVFDAANKVQLGTDQGYCIRVVVGKSWECFWTLMLKDGQITVEGPFSDQGDSVMVITGGTGKYTGAKGSMKLHPRDAKGSAYDFAYDLQ